MPASQRQPTESEAVDDALAVGDSGEEFEAFVAEVEPRLRRGLAGWCGPDLAHDATAEALAWAWENWARVKSMANPAGYLYRVAQSKVRVPRQGHLPPVNHGGTPEVEPELVPALLALPTKQRNAVWLVHGCGWSYADCAEAMGISASAVGTHVSRALAALRRQLEVDDG